MDGDDKFHQGRFLNSTYEADAEEEENDSNDEVQHEESYDLFYHHHEDNTSSYIAEIHPSSFISHPNSSKLTSQKSQKRSQSISGSCNGFFDELNVVELVEWKDLSEFDMEEEFLSFCKEVSFDPFNRKATTVENLWSQRRCIRPTRGPVPPSSSSNILIQQENDEPAYKKNFTSVDDKEVLIVVREPTVANSSIKLEDKLDEGSLADQCEEDQKEERGTGENIKETILRLLPAKDPRRRVNRTINRAFNTVGNLSLLRRCFDVYFHQNVDWENRFVGDTQSPYGPKRVCLQGSQAVARYYDALVRTTPDSVFHVHESRIKLLRDGSAVVMLKHFLHGTKMFLTNMEQFEEVRIVHDQDAEVKRNMEESAAQRVALQSMTRAPNPQVYSGVGILYLFTKPGGAKIDRTRVLHSGITRAFQLTSPQLF